MREKIKDERENEREDQILREKREERREKDKLKGSRENEERSSCFEKNLARTNYSSRFSIYMIRIRFFGPGELIQNGSPGAQYVEQEVATKNIDTEYINQRPSLQRLW